MSKKTKSNWGQRIPSLWANFGALGLFSGVEDAFTELKMICEQIIHVNYTLRTINIYNNPHWTLLMSDSGWRTTDIPSMGIRVDWDEIDTHVGNPDRPYPSIHDVCGLLYLMNTYSDVFFHSNLRFTGGDLYPIIGQFIPSGNLDEITNRLKIYVVYLEQNISRYVLPMFERQGVLDNPGVRELYTLFGYLHAVLTVIIERTDETSSSYWDPYNFQFSLQRKWGAN